MYFINSAENDLDTAVVKIIDWIFEWKMKFILNAKSRL